MDKLFSTGYTSFEPKGTTFMPVTKSQMELFSVEDPSAYSAGNAIDRRTGSFVDNMCLPVHRWFRYSAGFSAKWAEDVIKSYCPDKSSIVLDPFVGSGTTLIAGNSTGVQSIGFETHEFVFRIASSKLSYEADPYVFLHQIEQIIHAAEHNIPKNVVSLSPLLAKCYTKDSLLKLESLKWQFYKHEFANDQLRNLVWLAITGILRECSGAGTAPWQYILPNKSKAKVLEPFYALRTKAKMMFKDILLVQSCGWRNVAKLFQTDIRNPSEDAATTIRNSVDMVITSPPYPNNYDYADATRLEMTFWDEITGWGDLHDKIRKHLIRSCSQHTAKDQLVLSDLLSDKIIDPIHDELEEVCEKLSRIRLSKGGKKTYHTMVAAYFCDMGRAWQTLRKLCRKGATCCWVVGDSAPYGVYVPVDKWLGDLALAAGFHEHRFEKIRDRNIKWKNRKHRVPLQEGNLWVKG